MVNVLLVDDDFLVRRYLSTLIDWEAEGLKLYPDAANGHEALQLMQEIRPDILITDISMPVMDGIALIREVKQREPALQILVLSCHDEFAYVREAMKLGADEYVLKHMLTEEGFLELVRCMRRNVARMAQAQQTQFALHTLAAKGMDALKKEMIRKLLEEPQQEQQPLLSAYGLQGSYHTAAVLAFRGNSGDFRADAAQQYAQYLQEDSAEWVAYQADVYVLIDFTGSISTSARHETLFRLIRKFQTALREGEGAQFFVGISEIVSGNNALSLALQQARHAVSLSFYGQKTAHIRQAQEMSAQLPQFAFRLERTFNDPVVEGWGKSLLFKAALEAVERERTDPAQVLAWISRMDAHCLHANDLLPIRFLTDCIKRLPVYEAVWFDLLQMPLLQTKHGKVEAAATFIRNHYNEPISLADAAKTVELNPAYLSYLFKHEAGVNFSEYLFQCRLHRAKHLLSETDMSIKDAATASGFTDYQYFCKQFRQLAGMRPNEFRHQSKNKLKT